MHLIISLKDVVNILSLRIEATLNHLLLAFGIKVASEGIYLPKLGWLGYFNSCPIPEGFKVKSATVRLKADGLYITLKIEDKAVPSFLILYFGLAKVESDFHIASTFLLHITKQSTFIGRDFGAVMLMS